MAARRIPICPRSTTRLQKVSLGFRLKLRSLLREYHFHSILPTPLPLGNCTDHSFSFTPSSDTFRVGKPTIMNAFGIVTQDNAPFFVPFNSTIAPFNGTVPPPSKKRQAAPVVNFGVTNAQQDDAYTQWVTAAAQNGVAGAVQYQWGADNLTPQDGSIVSPNNAASDTVPNNSGSDSSPNDGYQSAPCVSNSYHFSFMF